MTQLSELAARVEALGPKASNSLDVQIEVALFKPNTLYSAIRTNAAGTKVIYTDAAGHEVTYWAEDWTHPRRRISTAAALRAQGGGQ